MAIQLRYFALMRELLGREAERIELPAGSTAGDAFARIAETMPRLMGLQRSVMLMVNQEYVRPNHELHDGDELAFIPPVSGGDGRFRVTDAPLDPREVENAVAGPDAGAIVTFTGTVRDQARGKAVTGLDYEAYVAAAEKMLARIGGEIADRWPGVRTAIVHRTGYLEPGVASVVIAIASAHRDEAFAACAYAIERIKQIVPIWKKEHYADGAVWVGSEADYQRGIGRTPVNTAPASTE